MKRRPAVMSLRPESLHLSGKRVHLKSSLFGIRMIGRRNEVREVQEPPGRPTMAASPDVCGFFFYRRSDFGRSSSLPPGLPQQETLMRCMFGSSVHQIGRSPSQVLSHAYSNGHRGVPKDPIEASKNSNTSVGSVCNWELKILQRFCKKLEAFRWSEKAMSMGDARGRFDVAYSLEFGLGTEKDTAPWTSP